jgi:hypothetical protein
VWSALASPRPTGKSPTTDDSAYEPGKAEQETQSAEGEGNHAEPEHEAHGIERVPKVGAANDAGRGRSFVQPATGPHQT